METNPSEPFLWKSAEIKKGVDGMLKGRVRRLTVNQISGDRRWNHRLVITYKMTPYDGKGSAGRLTCLEQEKGGKQDVDTYPKLCAAQLG